MRAPDQVLRSHRDIFIVIDGVGVAKRGRSGTPEASTRLSPVGGSDAADGLAITRRKSH